MAYFAELDENNIVLSVMAVHNNELLIDGVENEQKGIDFCNTIKPARWLKTSFSGSIRKQYAGIGFKYNEVGDVFIQPQPFASWSLNENYDWQAPTPKPEGHFYWDESSLSWIPIPEAS